MGLPIKRFIAANNRNDVFLDYLKSGQYTPRPSVQTIANAMDVGDPSNFARILDLFSQTGDPHQAICEQMSGSRFTDEEIAAVIRSVYRETGYLLDPHGACGYQALVESPLAPQETGIFLETAHPAKFKDTIEQIIEQPIQIPDKIMRFFEGTKHSVPLSNQYVDLKSYLQSCK